MAKTTPAPPADKVELYERLVATNPGVERKGAGVNYLQGEDGNSFVFSRGISPVGRKVRLTHFQAYGGPEPPPLDHQGIDDAFIEEASVVQYFSQGTGCN